MLDLFSETVKENGAGKIDLYCHMFISWNENENRKYGK